MIQTILTDYYDILSKPQSIKYYLTNMITTIQSMAFGKKYNITDNRDHFVQTKMYDYYSIV